MRDDGSYRHSYSLEFLLAVRLGALPGLLPDVIDRVASVGLSATSPPVVRRRHRGCRAGRSRRSPPTICLMGNGCHVVFTTQHQQRSAVRFDPPLRSSVLVHIHIERHSASPRNRSLTFGLLNIRSLANKLDDLLEVRQDQGVAVLLLTETWHDSTSVSMQRLRSDGYRVIERARPRIRDDTLATNHGGVAVIAEPGVCLSAVDIGRHPTTFECLVVRITSRSSSCVVLLVYRPGSVPVTNGFFVELADVIDRLITLVDPIIVAGDFNVRPKQATDPIDRRFDEVLTAHGLTCRVATPTHQCGGVLDIIATRDDLPPPVVDVLDVGLSDHMLLRWSTSLTRPSPVYTSLTSRPWRHLDVKEFIEGLRSSSLCDPAEWLRHDVDSLLRLYNDEITAVLDRVVPVRTVRCRRRPSDPWFDDECRSAKRCVRLLERASRRANSCEAAAAAAVWTAERRRYRHLLKGKRQAFWQHKIESERFHPRQLWRSVDALLGRGRVQADTDITADEFHRYFDTKVANVRAATAGAPEPDFMPVRAHCQLHDFKLVTAADVIAVIRSLPDKQCSSDPLPTRLLKDNVDILAPFCVELFNRSLLTGTVPPSFKSAYITPLLKKTDLDPADVKSYRPISNLSVLSKLLERLVARQLIDYLNTAGLMPILQSAYRAYHSTETAVLRVMSDILQAIDAGNLAMLTLLDLSAAFDTVDHPTLLRRLQQTYGLDGTVLGWFSSYLKGRTQSVCRRGKKSTPTVVLCGVPQGSVLGPILFLLYTADLLQLIEGHQLHPHLYADDTQVYGFCSPSDTFTLQGQMSACVDSVAIWMQSNRLQLNSVKTEVLWCSSTRRQHQIPQVPIRIGADTITPVVSVRDLGIYLDSDLSMRTHVSKTASSCFAMLRQIRSIQRSTSAAALRSIVVSLVLSRLDYGNALLAGLPDCLLARLQSVQNAAARLIFTARKYDHITPLLCDLHWLRLRERIDYKLAVLVFRCLHGLAPSYLARDIHRVGDLDGRRHLRSALTAQLDVPRSRCATIGDRTFAVAAARAWNRLPPSVTSAASMSVFKKLLKTHLFSSTYGPFI